MDDRPVVGEDKAAPEPPDAGPTIPDAPAPARRGAELRTFLIADIRGYTSYTEERGDEEAASLAARFADLVEFVTAEFEGVLLEVRGDEALVVFFSARQALRAAVELQARSTSLPLPIGIGLDAGEAIPVGTGYRGTALNVAARLCSTAKGGDIVASEAVIHMAARIDGVTYLDARSVRLKGLEDPVRAVSVVPESRAPRGIGRSARRASRRLTSRRILGPVLGGTAAVAAVVLAMVSGALGPGPFSGQTTRPSPSPAATPIAGDIAVTAPTFLLLDAATKGPAGAGQIGARSPGEGIFAEGSFWQLENEPPGILRIDPATGAIQATFVSPVAQPGGFTVDSGTLWVADSQAPRVVPIDIATREPGDAVRLTVDPDEQRGTGDIVVADGSLWVSVADCCEVRRIDPATGRVEAVIPVAGSTLALDGDRIWVLSEDGHLTAIDVASGDIAVDEVALPPDVYADLAAGDGWVWTAGARQGVLLRVDRSGRLDRSVPTGAGARSVSYADGVVWVGNEIDGTITSVATLTGETDSIATGHWVANLVAGAGRVLAGLVTAFDPLAGLEGDTLLMAVAGDPLDPFDPAAMAGSAEMLQITEATCARLVRYRPAPPPEGWRLEPELATSLPEVSADGRTYTFTVRDGYAFSPPSNEPVTAEAIARSIERVFSPGFGSSGSWWGYIGEIKGASLYQGGMADHVEGIAVDGDRLTITLATTTPDFLDRLALPFFCPVPLGTPVVPNGFNPPDGLASAGPFYIARADDQAMVLQRNPNHPGPRTGAFDNIVILKDQDIARAIGRVERGEIDYVFSFDARELAPDGPVSAAWGPSSDAAAAGDQRYFNDPTSAVVNLGLKQFGSEPLADPAIRQAIAIAVDRPSIAAAIGGRPHGQLLGLAMPGHRDVGVLPIDGPQVDAARALLAGRTVPPIEFAFHDGCVECEIIMRDLRAIGLTVEPFLTDNVYDESADISWFWGSEFQLDPVRYLDGINGGPWGVNAQESGQQELGFLAGQERIDAAADLADEWAAEQAFIIPLATAVSYEYFSERIGCQSFPARYTGVDLTSLCLD